MPGTCFCRHHKVVPILVFLFGALFLLFNLGVVTAAFTNIAWPLLVILAGIVKMKAGTCGCYKMPHK